MPGTMARVPFAIAVSSAVDVTVIVTVETDPTSLRSTLEKCIEREKEFPKITGKRSGGSEWRPSRDMLKVRATLEACTYRETKYPKTTRKRSSGSEWRPSREMLKVRTDLEACTLWE